RGIAHEALVVEEDRQGIVMAGDEPEQRLAVDPRLAEDGILFAHPRKRGVGLCAEAVAVEVVFPGGGHRLILTICAVRLNFPTQCAWRCVVRPTPRRRRSPT